VDEIIFNTFWHTSVTVITNVSQLFIHTYTFRYTYIHYMLHEDDINVSNLFACPIMY